MPYKKNYKKRTYKKKRYIPREPSYRQLAPKAVGMSKSPVPAHKFIHSKYVATTRAINPGAGIAGIHVWSCNGMYDPDITSTGHQPMGFDEWMMFYEHYTVLSAKITVSFMPNFTDSTANQYVCGIYTDSNTTSSSTVTALLEQPGTLYSYLTPQATKPLKLTKTWAASSFFGKTKADVMAESELKGSDAANPSEQAYWHTFVAASDYTGIDAASINLNVQIEFFSVLTERLTIGQS